MNILDAAALIEDKGSNREDDLMGIGGAKFERGL